MSSLVRNFGLGFITLWFGSLASIPTGFALCDGTQGTPDLRDRFLVGAGDTYNPDDTGGSVNHNHTFTSNGHAHITPAGTDIGAPFNVRFVSDVVAVTGASGPTAITPPFHSLVYIMEL